MKMRKSSQMKSDGQRQKRGVKNYVTWNDIADHAPPVVPPPPTSWQFFDIRQETEVKPKIFGRIFGYFVFPASGLNENEKLLCVGVCPSNVKERKTKVESNGQKPWKQNGRQPGGYVCMWVSQWACVSVCERGRKSKSTKKSVFPKKKNRTKIMKSSFMCFCLVYENLICVLIFSVDIFAFKWLWFLLTCRTSFISIFDGFRWFVWFLWVYSIFI